MTTFLPRLRQFLFVVALVALALAGTVTDAAASHFRYGTLTWQVVSPTQPNVVKIRFTGAWRWSYPWGGINGDIVNHCTFNPPDGASGGSCPALGTTLPTGGGNGQDYITIVNNSTGAIAFQLPVSVVISAVNPTEDWLTGTYETTVTLPAATANYTATFTNSARTTALQGGNGGGALPYTVTAGITVLMTGVVNQPPTFGTVPIIRIPVNQPWSYQLPISDPDGQLLTTRVSTTTESGLSVVQPNSPASGTGAFQVTSGGHITWTPNVLGLWAVQFRTTDTVGAYTVVDALISVENSVGLGQPPTIGVTKINGLTEPNPTENKSIIALLGQPTTFDVQGSDAGDTVHPTSVTLQVTGVPTGAAMTPALPLTALTATSTFSFSPTVAAVGTYIMNFSGIDGDGMQASNAVTLEVVNAHSATTTITATSATPSSAAYGHDVTLSAIVQSSSAAPPGHMQFLVDDLLVGTADLTPISGTQAQGTFVYNGGAIGTHSVTARYVGAAANDVYYQTSTSATPASYTVAGATATTTTLTTSLNPAQINQLVTWTMTVSPTGGATLTPQGTLAFWILGQNGAGNGLISGPTTMVNGSVTVSNAHFAAGTDQLFAVYTPASGSGYNTSTSPILTQVITTLSNATVAVTSTQNPVTWPTNPTFTATVTSTSGSTAPTGTVTFTLGTGPSPIVLGTVALGSVVGASAEASIVSPFGINASSASVVNLITATYNGSATFNTATGSFTETVNQATVLPTITAVPSTSAFGQPVTFTVSIGAPGNSTRKLTLSEGATVLGGPSGTLGSTDVVATFVLSNLGVGTHTITGTALLPTDPQIAQNLDLTTRDIVVTVNPASTSTVGSSSPNPSFFGQPVTLSATVSRTSAPAGPLSGGSVIFTENGNTIAGPATTDVNGLATASVANLATGDHQITAQFLGSPNILGSSSFFTQTVKVAVTFSQPFAAHAGCICTPLLMNTNTAGTQTWFVKALGTGPLTITSIARAVNGTDPETVVASVYDATNALQFTLNASYGAGTAADTEAAQSNSIAAPIAGAIYRVDVTTPGASSTQSHYRLKFDGAEAAGTGSPSSPSFEKAHHVKWYFNTDAGEGLNARLFVAGTPADTTSVNYTLTDPTGAVSTGSATATTAADATISGVAAPSAGTWSLVLDDASDHSVNPANGHYALDKIAGNDRGIYEEWDSAGTGTLHLTAVTSTPGGPLFTGPVQFAVTGPDGVTFTQQTSTGTLDLSDLPTGHYTVGADAPAGWSLNPGTYGVDVLCDQQATQEVVIVDPIPPVVTVPSDVTLEATEPGGAHATFTVSASDDGSGAGAPTCNFNSGDLFAIGQTLVSCSATDASGNVGSASFHVTVQDTTAPVVTVPANITAEAIGASGAPVTFSSSALDIVDGAVATSCSAASGSTFGIATTTVTCTATDAHNNTGTASFDVTVHDTTPPVVTVPANITAEAVSAAGTAVTFTSSALDIVDGAVATSCTAASGAMFGITTTTVTCTATDGHNNTGTASFTVTVRDTTPPVVTAPVNVIAEATSSNGATVSYSGQTATDAVSTVSASCAQASGTLFPIGTTTVTCSATDAAGNTGTTTFTVTVRDTTAPVVTAPANITAEATGSGGTTVTYSGQAAADAVSTVNASCVQASGSLFAIGTTTVTCSATDAAGNTGTASFTVTVRDTTKPVVTAPANIIAEATGSGGATVAYSGQSATDVVSTVSASCVQASGSLFAIGTTTVNCSATDAAGNTGTATFTVTVRDTTAPVVTVPSNITAEATGAAGAAVSFTTSALDTVNGAVATSCTKASGSTFSIATTIVTCTASDTHGNTGSATFTVTVRDTTAPAVTVPANVIKEATGPTGAVVTYGGQSATDAVSGAVTVSCVKASGQLFALGTTTVTCSATDAHSNTGTATFTVTVRDTTAPVVTAPANITTSTSGTNKVVTYSGQSATDVVTTSVTATCSPASGSTFGIGTTTVTCSATDAAGNTGTKTFTVTVNSNGSATIGAGQTVTFSAGTVNGNLSLNGGTAVLTNGSHVNGSVTMTSGSNLTISGGSSVAGNVVLTGSGSITINGGTVNGSLTIFGNGSLSLNSGTVHGNVALIGGGPFTIGTGVVIDGNFTISGQPASATVSSMCGALVNANVVFQGNAAPVNIGSTPSCAGNTIHGNLQILNNSAAVRVFSNHVSANLSCSGNTAAIAGGSNSAATKTGQCSAF